jgi:hypothetical protein
MWWSDLMSSFEWCVVLGDVGSKTFGWCLKFWVGRRSSNARLILRSRFVTVVGSQRILGWCDSIAWPRGCSHSEAKTMRKVLSSLVVENGLPAHSMALTDGVVWDI